MNDVMEMESGEQYFSKNYEIGFQHHFSDLRIKQTLHRYNNHEGG